jgi:hypothetical protein
MSFSMLYLNDAKQSTLHVLKYARSLSINRTPIRCLLQGYEDLERPLVGGDDEDDYEQQHGVSGPQGSAYRPPGGSGGGAAEGAAAGRPASFTVALPSQTDEIQEISVLSKDASEILWEMVAMGETGESMLEMRSRAEMLQAQLRGLINDYAGGDEKIFAGAFEAYEMISRCLDDQKPPQTTPATEVAEAVPQQQEAAPAAAAEEQPRPAAIPPPAPGMPAVAASTASGGADLISFE